MRNILAILLLFSVLNIIAQEKECKLKIGTNLSGISDWMTEMPFVDMMHHARTWGTRSINWYGGENDGTWNSNLITYFDTDEQGYPLEVPYITNEMNVDREQIVFTVWAIIDAWEPGIYTFLYDGEGEFKFGGDGTIIKKEQGKAEVEIIPSESSLLELKITKSKRGNHLRNFKLITPGHKDTHQTAPFNPLYLERLQDFTALRFMDWGSTNNWGESAAWKNFDEPNDTILVSWNERSKKEYYTWAHSKGVPYEVMCELCNTTQKDMWVCVPHNASNQYIRETAKLIKQNLDSDLKIYAEYSNEIWNWMFGQTKWLNKFFCEGRGIIWPEGIVDNVQRNLDIWNDVFSDNPERLINVAGGQTAWQDVSNRIVLNLKEGSFDALNITGYFGLSEEGDAVLDELGESATVADIAYWVRKNMYEQEISYIQSQYELSKQLNIPIVFYEAGQHITAHPFGEEPTYAKALLEIQRDTAIYKLYKEWFSLLEGVFKDGEEALYMNFSFVGGLSSRYGSFGILETLNQDTSLIPAPKYQAIIDEIQRCNNTTSHSIYKNENNIKIKRIGGKVYEIHSDDFLQEITVFNASGKCIANAMCNNKKSYTLTFQVQQKGLHLFDIRTIKGNQIEKILID